MAYAEQEARDLIIQAGHRLVKAGLIARTWGNISARISDTQFVITPSGLAYETLTPRQLVVVNIADCSYSGDIKPSSEKGVHADAYRLRQEVNFVIHTHQNKATAVGVAGRDLGLGTDDEGYHGLLGEKIPCAAYGMSSTKKLRRAVAAAVGQNPSSRAVLMRHHGALCMGREVENAFQVATALEEVCARKMEASFYEKGQEPVPSLPDPRCDYGASKRQGDSFCWERGGESHTYRLDAVDLPKEAAVHAAIYRHSGAQVILHQADPQVVAVSARGATLEPLLDDLVQIAGVDVRCAQPTGEAIAQKLRGRNAVLVRGQGALCTGKTADDAQAVCLILQKGCEAQRFAALVPGCSYLGKVDAFLQRAVYTLKYSKRKK